MEEICIYLIHNNSPDRIDLRNKLKNLSNNLNIKLIEIYKQDNNFKINLSLRNKLLILKIYFLRFSFDFKHKKNFSLKFYYFLLKRLIKLAKSIFCIIFSVSNKNENTLKKFKIESLVMQKHIKAWEHFLKSNKKIMIIFEDDAICKKDAERRLIDVLGSLKNIDFENIYIDLAGGLNLYDVIPKSKIQQTQNDFTLVKGIYTNTACSYLIHQNLTRLLFKEYQKTKMNEFFPIDHLINKLAMNINRSQNIFSIHFHKPLFTHGSFKGNIKSWQIY